MRARRSAAIAVAAATALVATAPAAHAAGTCAPWTQRTLASGLGSLENLEFDDTGGLLISASSPGAIDRLTRDGTVATLVPNVSSPGGQRLVGRTLYFNTGDAAQAGVFGTPNGTIESFDLDTHVRTTFASGLTMPNGLAVLPNGDFVVSRDLGSGTGITRVPKGDPAHPQTNWAAFDDQNGMAVDPTGTWLYADQTFTQDSAIVRIRIADPSDRSVVAQLGDDGTPKGLDDMTIDASGRLYVAAQVTGTVIRLDPATGERCTIVTGLQNPSSLKFGRGPGWQEDHLFLTSFDGTVRELTPPKQAGGPAPGRPAAKSPRLALSVRPRRIVAGRRTRVRFTVYGIRNGHRTRVAGARVRFGGRATRTNRRGRAGLTVRFRRPGHRSARAARAGYAPASVRVRVRN